ncbi:MAG TPA: anhydro-N-acetylmuramic acid kinase, partial [bacterium]
PANMVIDALMQRLFNQPFDRDGRTAQAGKVNDELLASSLNHPYFKKPPPKSTGREEFGADFCSDFLNTAERLQVPPNDIIASAAQLTTHTVWQNYHDFVEPLTTVEELIVSGGGAKNNFIMDSLRKKFQGVVVNIIDDYGIPADAKEAVCFAVLANETITGNSNNVPAATGAMRPTILGKICL